MTLTKPFYIGVFEVTQKQYKNVMGSASGFWNMTGDAYPTTASYSNIRGVNNYPSSTGVGANSFVGKLMAKSKLSRIDLPTEAQWEYACRAGTITELNSGKGLTPRNVKEVACVYEGSICTDIVGAHKPNSWLLYDMHGNAPEMCLDYYQDDLGIDDVIDPKGPSDGGTKERVIRGCGWKNIGSSRGTMPEAIARYSSCARGTTNCQCGSATCGRWDAPFRLCMTIE